MQAVSGLASIQGGSDQARPRLVRTIVPDKLTAITAAQAITAALLARERTGEGQHVRLSMLDAVVSFLWASDMGSQTFVGDEFPQQEAASFIDLIYETADGYISAAVQTDREWAALTRALDRPEWLDDPRFASPALRQKNIDARLQTDPGRADRPHPAAYWLDRLTAEGVPCAPVLTRGEVIRHPQVLANDVIVEVDHPAAGACGRPARRRASPPPRPASAVAPRGSASTRAKSWRNSATRRKKSPLSAREPERVSWQERRDEIARMRLAGQAQGGEDAVARQHEKGRLTIRERIDGLLDAGSFREIGALAGGAERDEDGRLTAFTPANFVLGTGRIDGRACVVGGEDFTISGGSPSPAGLRKSVYTEQLACQYRIPLVRLHEGSGGSVTGGGGKTGPRALSAPVFETPRFASVGRALATVPVASAALGAVAGLPAVRLVSSHYCVMTRHTAQVLAGGPALVERALGQSVTKDELGGAALHEKERRGGRRGGGRAGRLRRHPALPRLPAAERVGAAAGRRAARRSRAPGGASSPRSSRSIAAASTTCGASSTRCSTKERYSRWAGGSRRASSPCWRG